MKAVNELKVPPRERHVLGMASWAIAVVSLSAAMLASQVPAQEITPKALEQARTGLRRAIDEGKAAGVIHLAVRDGMRYWGRATCSRQR